MKTLLKKFARWIPICLTALVLASPAAQAEGWSLGKLNPFAKSSSSSKKKKSLAMPTFKLPKWKTPAPIKTVNRTTSNVAKSTWDTLTFWDNKKPANPWTPGTKSYKKAKPKSDSWLSNLFTAKEESGPKTPGEFLSQKRPE